MDIKPISGIIAFKNEVDVWFVCSENLQLFWELQTPNVLQKTTPSKLKLNDKPRIDFRQQQQQQQQQQQPYRHCLPYT
jgi:hypothetical protein